LAIGQLVGARQGLAGASAARARSLAAAALEGSDTPLARYASGLAAAWEMRTADAEADLARVVAASGQPFAAEILAQLRVDLGRVDDALSALDRVPAPLQALRGVRWTRARAEAARGSTTKAGVLAADLLGAAEVPSDETNLDIVLREIAPDARLSFLRNLHAKTSSPLVRGRLCHAEALAATPWFVLADRIGARRLARAWLAALFPGRRPPPVLVVLLLVLSLPVALVRLLLLPLPLDRYLRAHARATLATGQNPVLDLPKNGRAPLALEALRLGSLAAARWHAALLLISAGLALGLSAALVRIESRMPER
jgi:hypothetical protein